MTFPKIRRAAALATVALAAAITPAAPAAAAAPDVCDGYASAFTATALLSGDGCGGVQWRQINALGPQVAASAAEQGVPFGPVMLCGNWIMHYAIGDPDDGLPWCHGLTALGHLEAARVNTGQPQRFLCGDVRYSDGGRYVLRVWATGAGAGVELAPVNDPTTLETWAAAPWCFR